MSNKIKIGNREVNEDSQVVTNIKTIFWFLGIVATVIIALTTYFYISLKGQIDENATRDLERAKNLKKELIIEVKDVAEDNDQMKEDVWEIKGDVKLLLDRTNGVYQVEPTPNPIPSQSNSPVNSAGNPEAASPNMSLPPLDSLQTEIDN